MEHQSEVARLLAQIDAEYQAGHQALHRFASGTTRHAFITTRMENMYKNVEELRTKFGEEVAMQALIAWQDAAASSLNESTGQQANHPKT